MAQPQVGAVQIPFVGGVDESTRPELLDAQTAWVTGENVRQQKRGGWSKRYGFTAQTLARLSGSRSAGYKLFARGLQSCVVDGHYLDVYSPAAGVNVSRDRVPEASVKRIPVQYTGLTPIYWDLLYTNGYFVAAVATTTGSGSFTITLLVIDATTYGVVRQDTYPSEMPAGTPCLSVLGTTVHVVYQSATNTISARALDVSSPSGINLGWSSKTSLATDSATVTTVATLGLSDRFAVAYTNTSGGTDQLTVATFNTSMLNLETQTINTSSATPQIRSVSLCGSVADTLWVTWSESNTLKIIGLDADALTSTPLATTVSVFTGGEIWYVGSVVTGTGTARVVAGGDSTTNYRYASASIGISGGAATSSTTATWWWLSGAGEPVLVDGRVFAPVHHASTIGVNGDNTFFFVDVTEASSTIRPVANIAPGLSYGYQGLPRSARVSSTKYAVLHTVQRFGSVTTGSGTGLELVVLDFADPTRWQPVQDVTSTTLTGGVTSFFDGASVCEAGFVVRPGAPPAVTTSGTGITCTVGWNYVVTYEHVDAAGNIHISGVSNPRNSGVITNKTVAVKVPNLFVTSRYDTAGAGAKVRIVLYRTTDGGDVYYRLTELTNDTTSAEQTYSDITADSALTGFATLYRRPSQSNTALDRRCPPASRAACFYNDMLVVVADDGFTLWPSAQPVVGEGRWWSPIFQIPILEGGDIIALAAQDGTLFAFKRRSIFAINGEAPTDNGAQGGLGAPRRLAVDVGCVDPRSVVVTSLGVFFQSERGIELLTRSQSVEWVGEPVQDTTAAYPTCTAATLDPAQNLVLFELASTEAANQVSGTGRTVVFDLTLKLWVSTDRRANSAGTADTPAQSGGIIYTGSAYRYAWLGTDGRVYAEDTSTYLDPGSTWVTMRGKTAKIRVTGLQGNAKLHSVAVLAESSTNHQTRINVAYDDSSSWTDSETWTASEVAALTREQLEVGCSREQVMSVQIQVEDLVPSNTTATPLTTGAGATWVGLAVNIGANNQRQGTTLLPSAHRK